LADQIKERVIKELTDREWLLQRGHNIIGSLQPVISEGFLLDADDGAFKWSSWVDVPGLLKIINEIIDNSLDEAIGTGFQRANKIDIKISSETVQVKDNGRGIPVEKSNGK